MLFKKEFLQDIVYEEFDETEVEMVKNTIYDTSRWSVQYELVFLMKNTNKYYLSYYSRGATEQQDEGAYEYDGDEIECQEVMKKEIISFKWVKAE